MSGRNATARLAAALATFAAVGAVLLGATVTALSEVPPVTITVNATADAPDAVPGDDLCASAAAACTLRAAIQEAVATSTPSVIELPAGHYVLGSALEIPQGTIAIRGAGRATTIIDAAHLTRAFDVFGGTALGLEDVTVSNGSATQEGGAIRAVDAALSLDSVTISTSAADGTGGGVYAAGSVVTITGSLFDGDTALAGGGLAVIGGDLTITGSTFTGCLATDVGGAVAAFAPHALAVTDSIFTANTAEHSGGAIFLAGAAGTAPYAISGSTFTGNESFGGSGGAIGADGLVAPGVDGSLVVSASSFTGNAANHAGGAISAAVAITSTANTFTNNYAPESPDVATPTPVDLCRDAGICDGSAIDAFRCYQAKVASGAPAFAPIKGVRLANGFGDVTVDVKVPQLLCAPADVDGDGLLDAATHLEAYAIKLQKGQAKPGPQTAVTVTSALGRIVVDTAKAADQLLVPAAADPVASPNLTVNQVDRFTCSKAKLTKGQPKLAKDLQLTVADALTADPKRVVVKKLVRLCAPVGENGGDTKHADYLLCVQVSATKGRCASGAPSHGGAGCKKEADCGGTKGQTTLCQGQPKFAKVAGLHVANDLDAETLDATKDGVVCLPAQRLP